MYNNYYLLTNNDLWGLKINSLAVDPADSRLRVYDHYFLGACTDLWELKIRLLSIYNTSWKQVLVILKIH